MKKEELRALIDEHLVLRKRLEKLQEEIKEVEHHYDENLERLYWFRSRDFLRSVLSYLQSLKGEYGEDPHFDDLVHSVIHSLNEHASIEQRKIYTPKHLLELYEEKVE